jgi:type VI secretion system protein ImpA
MASVAFAALAAPLSQDDPCGPDLDLDGDLDYMNFMARAEGLMPAAYFARDDEGKLTLYDRARDHQPIDFAAELAQTARFLALSRDIRLFALAARLNALNRDFAGFCDCVAAVSTLISERWDTVHPRAEAGDLTARMIALQTFDDMPTVILPLQHIALATSRRYGAIAYRNKMVAANEVATADEGETPMSATTIAAALDDADLPTLIATRDRVAALRDALGRISAVAIEQTSRSQAVSFDRLGPLAQGMFAFLDGAIGRRDPSAKAAAGPAAAAAPAGGDSATGEGAVAEPRPVGPVASVRQAAAALAAAGAYFMRAEPSNPAIPVIRQAEQLIGKSFSDVIRILFPADAERATIRIGGKQAFDLSFERIAALDESCNGFAAAGEPDALSEGSTAVPSEVLTDSLSAADRGEAIALLRAVGSYFRTVEPSSPIPLLTDRVCGFSQKDFLALISDVLPGVGMQSTDEAG